jgi:hypothetical protein
MASYSATITESLIDDGVASIPNGYFIADPDVYCISDVVLSSYSPTLKSIYGSSYGCSVSDGVNRNFLYDKIYFTPSSFNLGAVTGDILRDCVIWNANLYNTTLSSVSYSQSGVVFSNGSLPPDSLMALQEYDYVLSVDGEGSATVDCDILLTFSDGESFNVPVTGIRVVLWPWWPQVGMKEEIQPLTWVFTSDNGSEQRMRLRNVPRRSISITSLIEPSEWIVAQNLVRVRRSAHWAVPLAQEAAFITGTIASGSTVISVDTTLAQFRQDGLALLWVDSGEYFLSTISAVTDTTITFSDDVPSTLTGEIRILPCDTARMLRFSSSTDPVGNRTIQAGFQVYDGEDLSGQVDDVLLYGYSVLTERCEGDNVSDSFETVVWDVDYDTGPANWGSLESRAKNDRRYQITLMDRASLWWFRRFVYSHTNRDPFWMPTWESDFVVSANIGAASASIRVYDNGLLLNKVGIEAIMIYWPDGTYSYHLVSSIASYDADETTISLGSNTPNGSTISASDVVVSVMRKCVISGDIGITHQGQHSVASFTAKEVYA